MSKELIQVFMGMTGSLGFAILYHIREENSWRLPLAEA
jgi:hypothetical protein